MFFLKSLKEALKGPKEALKGLGSPKKVQLALNKAYRGPNSNLHFLREDEKVEEGAPANIELQVEKTLESPDRQSPEQEA